jgi:hypothetical protein
MNCPKCGFAQAEGTECLRCGIILARYHSAAHNAKNPPQILTSAGSKQAGSFRRFLRIFRWISLAAVILVFYFMLRPSVPPRIVASPEAARRAEAKIGEFQSSIGRGGENRLEIDEAELNGWLSENLILNRDAESELEQSQASKTLTGQQTTETNDPSDEKAAMEQIQSSVRDVKIELLDETLRVYALFEMHGMDLSLELEGRPRVENGYIRLEPVRGKLGSLPLMTGTLKSVSHRLFESTENREKFKISSDIKDVRIEQGRLIVLSR